MSFLYQPWYWLPAGFLIGLTVPLLLLLGNKPFGISSSLRHICAACFPAGISFFRYDWKQQAWNLFFVAGIAIGGYIGGVLLKDPHPVEVAAATQQRLAGYGLHDYSSLLPAELFNWNNLFTLKGLIFFVIGGLLVGFGTRYAGGCTSGHSIMGISNLQWPSMVATMCFMAGGFFCANVILPWIFSHII
ncbi:YeeE/YedE family protein [Chitinophaga sp. Cy-1792]|uniref:YeeE/YedE family protein n=1 Tax=Chitinophaga sp. Cy-1792 TaxID=2608339 RepID=UPI001420201E|nr:YeeE/YedE thiosulfate transporter family protein [Chitinophaga sp. Cy-1792]NIG56073.1 YeeE/YedE family protein [Chitinophaga sp. Cy-1792]